MSDLFELKDDVLTLGEDVGVTQVAELYETLTQCLESGCTKISIDASKTRRVDGALLQLVAGFVHEVTDELEGEVQWTNPSDTFVAAAKMLDLNKVMRLH